MEILPVLDDPDLRQATLAALVQSAQHRPDCRVASWATLWNERFERASAGAEKEAVWQQMQAELSELGNHLAEEVNALYELGSQQADGLSLSQHMNLLLFEFSRMMADFFTVVVDDVQAERILRAEPTPAVIASAKAQEQIVLAYRLIAESKTLEARRQKLHDDLVAHTQVRAKCPS